MIINQVLWVPTRTDEHRIATCQTQLTIHPCLSSPFLPDLIRYHLLCWEEWEDPCNTWADDRRTLKTGAKQKHYSLGIWIMSTFSSEPLLLIHYEYRFFYFKFFFTYFSWFQSPRKTLKECCFFLDESKYFCKSHEESFSLLINVVAKFKFLSVVSQKRRLSVDQNKILVQIKQFWIKNDSALKDEKEIQ